jgi:hypothetical protein
VYFVVDPTSLAVRAIRLLAIRSAKGIRRLIPRFKLLRTSADGTNISEPDMFCAGRQFDRSTAERDDLDLRRTGVRMPGLLRLSATDHSLLKRSFTAGPSAGAALAELIIMDI